MTDTSRARPAPAEEIARAFERVAYALRAFRDEWKRGDLEEAKLVDSGVGSETSGYAALMAQVRTDASYLHGKLVHDADYLPFVLMYADPALRDRLEKLVWLMDPDAIRPDAEGNESRRWRQWWSMTGLDEPLEQMLYMLPIEADAWRCGVRSLGLSGQPATTVPVPTAGATDKASSTEPPRYELGEAVKRDDGDYRPGEWFGKTMTPRLRKAAAPERKSKKVRKKTVDGVVLYSVEDARRWWPNEVKKREEA